MTDLQSIKNNINPKDYSAMIYEKTKKYQNGELVWVNAYVRQDGTHVDGYYRSKPHND